jgi:hypothetical protein
VSKKAKGFPERAYAKWVVLHFMWQRISPVLAKRALRQRFREESEWRLFPPLSKAVDAAFRGASAYYRSNRGAGAKQVDPSVFFKRSSHHEELEKFWRKPANNYRGRFEKAVAAFSREMERLLDEGNRR